LIYVQWPPALPFADEVLPYFLDIAASGAEWLHLPPADTGKGQNMAAEALLQRDNSHIIFLDWDHKHPKDIALRFAKDVEKYPEIQVISGIYHIRTAPHRACVWIEKDGEYYTPGDWKPHIRKVYAIGFGCVMVAREVFERIEPPWFMYDYSDMERGGYKYPGCDIYFCKKMREAGIDIYCDFGIHSPHMTTRTLKHEDFGSSEKV
jgi:hypothetical protein